jgi:branched-chain amino acid transport system substrate-binding protein
VALALTACGGTSGGDTDAGATTSAGGSAAKACDLKIGYFGALTGDNANLGININNGAKLAIDQYNAKNADCKVTLGYYDSQGDPAQAPALAQKAVDDKKVIGLVGPAFSGESKAADPLFAEAGLVAITPSATNPACRPTAGRPSSGCWATTLAGAGAAKYISDVAKASKVVVVDDASEYGKGLADIVKGALKDKVVATDTVQQKQTDFSPTVTKIRSAKADASSSAGTTPRPAS